MSHFIAIFVVFFSAAHASALDFKSCKNSKQLQYLSDDLKLAVGQKLLTTDELKSLELKKTCDAYQFYAEELLKIAAERATTQSENVAEQEP